MTILDILTLCLKIEKLTITFLVMALTSPSYESNLQSLATDDAGGRLEFTILIIATISSIIGSF